MSNIERDPRFREDCFKAGMIGVDEQSAFYGLWKIAVARGTLESEQCKSSYNEVINFNGNLFAQMQIMLSELYAERDWHKLTSSEKQLCKMMEDAGYLTAAQSGFIGKAKLPDIPCNIHTS